MRIERGVNAAKWSPGNLQDNPVLFSDTRYGQVLHVRQTYSAHRSIVGMDFDAERTIDITIGHMDDWTPIVSVMGSTRDQPIEIRGDREAGLREAIQLIHDEIFNGWPPTDDDITAFIQRKIGG